MIATIGGGRQQMFRKRVIMLENQANPVRVHPPVPDGEVKTAHRLPKLGEDGVGEVLRVEHRGSRAARG